MNVQGVLLAGSPPGAAYVERTIGPLRRDRAWMICRRHRRSSAANAVLVFFLLSRNDPSWALQEYRRATAGPGGGGE